MNDHPVGVIDSGSGGLSVWNEIRLLLPGESTVYVGDHKHLPYSIRTTEYIRNRVKRILDFLVAKKVKLIVIACNTATVAGIDVYREYTKVPVIGVVPVIKTAVAMTHTGHIAVFSTAYTAVSSYQKELIAKFASGVTVDNIGSADLVTYIEDGKSHSLNVKRKLHVYLSHVAHSKADVLALGCTHYPFIKDEIRKVVGDRITLLDSGGAVARHVRRVLTNNNALCGKPVRKYEFYTTGDGPKVSAVAGQLLGEPVHFQSVSI